MKNDGLKINVTIFRDGDNTPIHFTAHAEIIGRATNIDIHDILSTKEITTIPKDKMALIEQKIEKRSKKPPFKKYTTKIVIPKIIDDLDKIWDRVNITDKSWEIQLYDKREGKYFSFEIPVSKTFLHWLTLAHYLRDRFLEEGYNSQKFDIILVKFRKASKFCRRTPIEHDTKLLVVPMGDDIQTLTKTFKNSQTLGKSSYASIVLGAVIFVMTAMMYYMVTGAPLNMADFFSSFTGTITIIAIILFIAGLMIYAREWSRDMILSTIDGFLCIVELGKKLNYTRFNWVALEKDIVKSAIVEVEQEISEMKKSAISYKKSAEKIRNYADQKRDWDSEMLPDLEPNRDSFVREHFESIVFFGVISIILVVITIISIMPGGWL